MKKFFAGLAVGLIFVAGVAVGQTRIEWPGHMFFRPTGPEIHYDGTLLFEKKSDGATLASLDQSGNALFTGGLTTGATDPVTFSGIRSVQVTENPASVATIVCAEQVLTTDATDLATGDIVIGTGVYVTGNAVGLGNIHVSSATEVTVVFCNPTAGALTPSATDFTIFVIDA